VTVGSAAAVLALITTMHRIQIGSTEHIAGKDNGRCDALSRREANGEWRSVETVLGDVPDMQLAGDEDIGTLIELCDPRRQEDQDSDFLIFWERAVSFSKRLAVPGLTL
jgi:hypothetical protein